MFADSTKLEMIKKPLVTLIAHDEYPAMASLKLK